MKSNQASTVPVIFTEQLKAAVNGSGLSRAEVAVATGYSVSALCKFMNRNAVPPMRARQPMLDAIEQARKAKEDQP